MDGRLAELPGHIVGAPTGPRVDVLCLEPCHCAQCHVERPNLCPGERAVHRRSPAGPLGRPEETRPTCHLLFASLSREDVDRNSPHCRQEAELQSSYPIWEDFNSKATKLHSQLRTTVLAAVAFLDAFQKVADMATNTRGATRDIGSALTRMCMRHRSIETKLRQFTNALLESLINPLQERIEDWKKSVNQLDKDHAKEYKRARHEIKKKSSDTLKLQKKARKELLGKGDLQPQLDSALQDVNDMYLLLEETEKQAVRRALIEERGRFCTFITFLQPVVNGELTMLGEITHLQGIIDDLVVLTAEPHKLPPASEQVIKDLKGSDYSWSYQTPPSSPSSSSSRKSSMCSAPSSSSSAKGGGAPWPGGAQTYSPSSTCRYRSLAQPATATARLSSISSHDSGFVSQDATYSKPPSPMPSDITSQKSSSSASSEASETCQSVSECSSPTSDWAKAGPHEQPSGTTLQRRKDRVELLRDPELGPASGGTVGPSGEEAPRPRMSPATIAAKHGEEVSPAASELAMVLTRGLSLEHQKSSRDSLQYSSGYSTQTTTPSCSEDTIPSQDSEGPPEFDKSSTIPRNSNIAQNYRRLIQTKRPASTAGLPTAGLPTASGAPPGVATIRRTPSTKPTVRRALSSAGPIPIRPPIVPVKTPTVPDSPGYVGPTRAGSEECVFYSDEAASPLAPDLVKASPKRLSLPNTAWASPASEPAGYPGPGAEDEQQQLAANRHSLVEKLGELVAGAHALGEGQFPFPTALSATPSEETPILPPAATGDPPAEDMLVAIRRGVRLRRTVTNDRSAPRIL
ncbi:protein MTSS 2 isoform X3 [Rhinolophus ferrumequinum]|uniref:protein MTSS 2 isoform X3 n=1 Tax=Rhinolophus ferrumequinum TaxID=59479 RepID=UPI00140F8289|nr:protein MTSS 2 isoform X3 [Rhinolophus ferrumequinum]